MNEETLLTLYCPQCKQITEVVTEGQNLVCLDCGWHFDEKTAAQFLAPNVTPAVDPSPSSAAR